MADMEIFRTADGECLFPPWLVPFQISAQAVLGVIDAILQGINRRGEPRARLKVQTAYVNGARSLGVPEKPLRRRGDDPSVMLRCDMANGGDMGGVVEGDPLLAVMDVEEIRDDMLAEDKAVFEPLHGNVSQRVVVVLVARHHQPAGMARILDQFLVQKSVADVIVQTELRIGDVGAGDVLEVDGALHRVHPAVVQVDSEFKVRNGERRHAEMPLA